MADGPMASLKTACDIPRGLACIPPGEASRCAGCREQLTTLPAASAAEDTTGSSRAQTRYGPVVRSAGRGAWIAAVRRSTNPGGRSTADILPSAFFVTHATVITP